jgi:hypothetical protein
MAEREYNDPGILGRLFPYFNKDIGETVDTSVEMKTNQQEPIKSGAGVDPTLVKAGVDLLSNYLSKNKTQSTPSQIPQMPQQYDTSPYRALDIIGAGIARRPTQEGYFNQLEKMQNARLEDAYNRRTDTDEAKNLQGLVKQTFPNLSDDIVSKISPDYFSKNYPLLAQMAEKSTNIQNKMAKDQTAKENFKIKYQGVIPDDQLASIIPSITADNLDVYDKKFAKDIDSEKASNAITIAQNAYKEFHPNATQNELNSITPNNLKDMISLKMKKDSQLSGELKAQAEENRKKDATDPQSKTSIEFQNNLRTVYGNIPGANKIIASTTASNYDKNKDLLDNLAKKNEAIIIKATGKTSSELKNSVDEIDKSTKKLMQTNEANVSEFINALKDYHDYIDKNGFSMTDPVLESQYGRLIALYKNQQKLGTLDNGVISLFDKIIKNPTSFSTIARDMSGNFKGNYLKTIQDISDSTYSSFANEAKLKNYQPSMLTEKPSFGKKEKYEEGQFYPDGKGGYFKWMNGKAVPVPK